MMTEPEIKNVFMAVAVGGLNVIARLEPATHTRKARMATQLAKLVMRESVRVLPKLDDHGVELAKAAIHSSEEVFERISIEEDLDQRLIELNLVLFCMEELPLPKKCYRMISKLFDCFNHAEDYNAIRAGERVWQRIATEIEILNMEAC
jgi:hypothetical protein